jgi:transposase
MNIPLDVLESMEQQAAQSLRESIDFEVLADVLVNGCGWTDVVIDLPFAGTDREKEIIQWVNANCSGKCDHRYGRWVFELAADAVLFKLKWA